MTILPFPKPPIPSAAAFLCPVVRGLRVPYGWKRILWRTVEQVDDAPVRLANGWLVPVLYRGGWYGLVHYRFSGDGELYDTVVDVRPNTLFTRALLRTADAMPQLFPTGSHDVVELSVEHMEDDSAPVSDGDTEVRKKIYILKLYGVLGPRTVEKDLAERYDVRFPQEFAPKWA